MIPTFLIVRSAGLIDTLGALILPNLATGFGVFMMRQFFRTLPVELEEAARIDGASRLGVLVRIVLPLSTPALATLGVITFMWTWNDFLWPLITIYSERQHDPAARPDDVPGPAPGEHGAADGRERDEHGADPRDLLRRAALVRARHRDVRASSERRQPARLRLEQLVREAVDVGQRQHRRSSAGRARARRATRPGCARGRPRRCRPGRRSSRG